MRGRCRLTWLPEAASGCPVRSANTPMSSRVGGPLLQWKPPSTPSPTLGSPITEFGSEDVKQTRCKWHFYLLVFASPSPSQHPSFTGIRSAISRSPMATAGLVNEGDNFLMMSPRHVIGGLLQRDRTRSEIQMVLIFGLEVPRPDLWIRLCNL